MFAIKLKLKSHPLEGSYKVTRAASKKIKIGKCQFLVEIELKHSIHYALKSLNGPILIGINSVALYI